MWHKQQTPHGSAVAPRVRILVRVAVGWLGMAIGPLWSQETPARTPVSVEWQPPVEFRPYRVAVELVNRDATAATDRLIEQFRRDLSLAVARHIGALWELVSSEESQVSAPSAVQDEPASTENPPRQRFEVDVVYHLAVSQAAGQVRVLLQAHEPLWNYKSPTETLSCNDPRELTTQALLGMVRWFRPQAEWDRVDDATVRLRVRGETLGVADPDLHLFRPDETYALWTVHRTRDGTPQRVSSIPWTLCRASGGEDVEHRDLARVYSGLPGAIGRRPLGRVELRAVACRPHWPQTVLELVTSATPTRPLVAHEVRISDLVPIAEPPLEWRRYSDSVGRVALEIAESDLPVWVTILSGRQTLARVPLAPGAVPQLRIELLDDSQRLRVEGRLQLLQGELVALVAKRRALMIVCRTSAERKAWTEVDAFLQQLQALPNATPFLEQVSGIRVAAVATAREHNDVLTEQRVNRLCDETQELLQRHLGDDGLPRFLEEMATRRAAANE